MALANLPGDAPVRERLACADRQASLTIAEFLLADL